jgi:tight adherence protein C
MITYIALGIGSGIGLWALAVYLFPPRPALGAVLAHATAPPAPAPILATDDTGWAARLGRPAVTPLRALGLPGRAWPRTLRSSAVRPRPIWRKRPPSPSLGCCYPSC